MSSAIVSLSVISKRMLDKREAAEHCGRSLKRFAIECSVSPVKFINGDLRYDVRDLDRWLDNLKNTTQDSDDIIKRLAGDDRGTR
jgi:hypothetical protein